MDKWIPLRMEKAEGYQVITKDGNFGSSFNFLILTSIIDEEREIKILLNSVERHLILTYLAQNKYYQSVYNLLGEILKQEKLKIRKIFIEGKQKAKIYISENNDFVCNAIDGVIISEKEKIPLFGRESLLERRETRLALSEVKIVERKLREAIEGERFEEAGLLKRKIYELKRKKYE